MACISLAPENEGEQQVREEIIHRSQLTIFIDFNGEKIGPTIRREMGQKDYETAGAPFPKHMPRILFTRGNSKQVLCDSGTQIRLIRRDPLVRLLLEFIDEQLGSDEFKQKIEEMIMEQFSYILDESWEIILNHNFFDSIKKAYLQSEPLARVSEFIAEHLYNDSSDPKLTVHEFEVTNLQEQILIALIKEELDLPDFEELPGLGVAQRPE